MAYCPKPGTMCLVKNFDQFTMLYFQIWGQSNNIFTKKVFKLQNRAMRILSFADFYANSDPLYKFFNILKLNDIIALQNCIFFKIFPIINFQSALTHTFSPLVTSIPLIQKDLNWAVFTYPFCNYKIWT